jgi:hypothetical protein
MGCLRSFAEHARLPGADRHRGFGAERDQLPGADLGGLKAQAEPVGAVIDHRAGCSPKAPPTTPPPPTCTATSSPPPAPSTGWKRPWPGSASSTTHSPWTCASPRTTSTASGAPRSAPPTCPPQAARTRSTATRAAPGTAIPRRRRTSERQHREPGEAADRGRSRGSPRQRPGRTRACPRHARPDAARENTGHRGHCRPASPVSRTFLYSNPDARTAVAGAITGTRQAGDRAAQDTDQEAAWLERALNAEDALKAAHAAILAQRARIGELLGQVRDLEAEWTQEATQRITTENTTLKQRVRQLAADNRTMDERLKAARSNMRFQDRRVADLEAQITETTGTAAT